MKTIGILDDEEGKRETFQKWIRNAGISEGDYEIGLLGPDDIKIAFEVMLERQSHFRDHDHGFWEPERPAPLDDLDILIIDNELREFFAQTGIFTAADEVAYMARCFSTCKLIVIVNRLGYYNPFDLTGNLSYQGQFEAFSDLEIGQAQLSSPALWGTGEANFHPWAWFVLPKWLDEFDRRLADVEIALQENPSILAFFGLENVREWLPRRILQALGDGNAYTFKEFLRTSSFAMGTKDRYVLSQLQEFSKKTRKNLSSIVASRLWKWLETQLLPELDILIDAPHLATRLPSLLTGNHADIGTWNTLAVRHTQDIPNLQLDLLEAALFPRTHWLTRPVWYWRKAMNDENIPDVREPWNIEYVPFVFCEDTSRFVPEERGKPYRASVDSSFGLRHIEKLGDVDYLPLQRLAL